MAIAIKKVETKSELKDFIRFNYELYKDNAYSVPDLLEDVLDTFNPQKNPAYDFCESDQFLAYRDGEIVGRVAAFINHKANSTWNTKSVRFGWIDFIDDLEVSDALLKTVEEWGRAKGCDKIIGPLGFTDLDPEGMLVWGFDQLSTMATIYNYPYYPEHMEKLGYEKEADWLELKIFVPVDKNKAKEEKYFRVAEFVKKRLNLRVRKFKSVKEIKESGYVYKMFDLINTAYAPLFGYSELTRRQVDKYANQYLPLIDPRFVPVIENEAGEPIGVGIAMPSLATALQKAKGKLFPLGWFHLLKALKFGRPKVLDLLLVAVHPDYQNKGVNAMLFADMIPIATEMGIEYAESNPQLETNDKVVSMWDNLNTEHHKRRRCYQKGI